MPLTYDEKQSLILPADFSIHPYGSYIRIAKVVKVSLYSRDMTVRYIDGNMEGGVILDSDVEVTCVVGSDDPTTTYAPSATVYGRDDICCVLHTESGERFAVSPLDMNTHSYDLGGVEDPERPYTPVAEHSNRKNFALMKDWALFDVLSGFVVDFLDNGASSFISFWNPVSQEIVHIYGDPDKRHILRRILDFFTTQRQNEGDYAEVDYFWYPYEKLSGGPTTSLQRKIGSSVFEGRNVNGFQFIQDNLFGQADMTADLTPYHPTLNNLHKASVHPLVEATLALDYTCCTVVDFGDEDPTHVLIIGCHPSWATSPYLKFVEVPVHSLTGRKVLEQAEDLPDNPGKFDIVQSWQRYSDNVRDLHTIDRSRYIDYTAHEADPKFGDYVQRSLLTYVPRFTPVDPPTIGVKETTFGIIDGFGYDQGGAIYELSKLKKIEGTITRTEIFSNEESYVNGSRYRYNIEHNNPEATANVDNWYTTRFEYEWNSGDMWERQTCLTPTKEYPHWTDGTNHMHRTLDFLFYTEGYYIDDGGLTSGRISWSDGQGNDQTATLSHHELWHKMYLNDVLLFTDYWLFEKGPLFTWGENTMHFIHYADPEYGLFVIEKVHTVIDESSNCIGPGQACTGTTVKTGIVLYGGVEYIIWSHTITLDTHPGWFNFYPWIIDTNAPDRPTSTPYSVDVNHNSAFYYAPFFNYFYDYSAGYAAAAGSYPSYAGDVCSTLYPRTVVAGDVMGTVIGTDKHSDYLQVSIDKELDSFAVKFLCTFDSDPPGKVTAYPNVYDILCRHSDINNGDPFYGIPVVPESTISLNTLP